jgi:hypothetical protein
MSTTTDTITQYNAFMDGLRKRYAELKAELEQLEKVPGLLDGDVVGNGRRKPGPKLGRKAGLKPGPKPGAKKTRKAKKGFNEVPDKATLKDLLKKADGNRLNRKGLNDAGYSLKSAILIAKENPDDFVFKQNKAQGEVWAKK